MTHPSILRALETLERVERTLDEPRPARDPFAPDPLEAWFALSPAGRQREEDDWRRKNLRPPEPAPVKPVRAPRPKPSNPGYLIRDMRSRTGG